MFLLGQTRSLTITPAIRYSERSEESTLIFTPFLPTSIQVKELAFIFHVVTDIPRARQFYEGLLGLKTGMQIEFGPGQWWIEYDIAGQALALSNGIPGKPAFALALEGGGCRHRP